MVCVRPEADAGLRSACSLQNNNALDLAKELIAAILNKKLWDKGTCPLPTGAQLGGPSYASVTDIIAAANALIGDRRIPNGLCDCCATNNCAAPNSCASNCDFLTKGQVSALVTLLANFNTYNADRKCG